MYSNQGRSLELAASRESRSNKLSKASSSGIASSVGLVINSCAELERMVGAHHGWAEGRPRLVGLRLGLRERVVGLFWGLSQSNAALVRRRGMGLPVCSTTSVSSKRSLTPGMIDSRALTAADRYRLDSSIPGVCAQAAGNQLRAKNSTGPCGLAV